jgi:hypothetical protein
MISSSKQLTVGTAGMLVGSLALPEKRLQRSASMYIVVRRYEHVAHGSVDEAIRRLNESFVPVISEVRGFVAYYAMKVRGGLASVSVVTDRTGADESNGLAATWMRENRAQSAWNPVQLLAGEVVAGIVARERHWSTSPAAQFCTHTELNSSVFRILDTPTVTPTVASQPDGGEEGSARHQALPSS